MIKGTVLYHTSCSAEVCMISSSDHDVETTSQHYLTRGILYGVDLEGNPEVVEWIVFHQLNPSIII